MCEVINGTLHFQTKTTPCFCCYRKVEIMPKKCTSYKERYHGNISRLRPD